MKSLADKEFRNAYVEDHIRTGIAFQIRALREQRGWSQGQLAQATGTTQSAISRVENPDYGKLSLQTLLEIAEVFDAPLLVQFVDWEDWLIRNADVSPSKLRKRGFDLGRLLALAGAGRTAQLIDPLTSNPLPSYLDELSTANPRQSVGKPPATALLDGKQGIDAQQRQARDNCMSGILGAGL